MDVQSTQAALRSASETINSGNKRAEAGDSLQKDDFLRLLMTQMTNQNPLDPMDSKGMMDQFAQMGIMEQLTNINGQMETLNATQGEIARSNAYTYLDKDVTVEGGMARVNDGKAPAMNYRIPRDANVQVHIRNENDAPVRTIEVGYLGSGEHQVLWDATNSDGETVPNGSYTYNVVAESDDGTRVPVDLFVTGKVSNVRFKDGKQSIHMNGEQYDVRDVVGVSNESERRFGGRDPLDLHTDMRPMPPVIDRKR